MPKSLGNAALGHWFSKCSPKTPGVVPEILLVGLCIINKNILNNNIKMILPFPFNYLMNVQKTFPEAI